MSLNILLTTSKIISLEPEGQEFNSLDSEEDISLPACSLKWKQNKLLVQKKEIDRTNILPALKNQQWLTDCLVRSPVDKICIDPELGVNEVKNWADAAQKAKKPIFLRLSANGRLPEKHNSFCWQIKLIADAIAAAVLLCLFSPSILVIACLIAIFSPGPIFFRQWRVGKRGRLFQIFKFRTMTIDAERQHDRVMGEIKGLHKRTDDPRVTPLGYWLRKYSLDELPQLFNVLRGEMSLVGPRPWALYDALRLDKSQRKRLNALPGITGAWQIEARSQMLDLKAVTKCDLEYLCSWSLGKDLKILLMTLPKVISGFGAY
jgi:lipopolysaccharide/colanic/teichoic acid biosynthesis glycosyltransferase